MWLFARVPFAIAGIVASYFVAEGSLRYDFVQLGVSLLMLAAFIAGMIYAPDIFRRLGKRNRDD